MKLTPRQLAIAPAVSRQVVRQYGRRRLAGIGLDLDELEAEARASLALWLSRWDPALSRGGNLNAYLVQRVRWDMGKAVGRARREARRPGGRFSLSLEDVPVAWSPPEPTRAPPEPMRGLYLCEDAGRTMTGPFGGPRDCPRELLGWPGACPATAVALSALAKAGPARPAAVAAMVGSAPATARDGLRRAARDGLAMEDDACRPRGQGRPSPTYRLAPGAGPAPPHWPASGVVAATALLRGYRLVRVEDPLAGLAAVAARGWPDLPRHAGAVMALLAASPAEAGLAGVMAATGLTAWQAGQALRTLEGLGLASARREDQAPGRPGLGAKLYRAATGR